MESTLTTAEWGVEIGTQLRSLRLRHDLDQVQLAERAGVAINCVKRLEAGKATTLTTFIKVLRALGQADWLKTLAPEVSISPLQMLKTRRPRQRASRARKSERKDV